MIKPEVSGAFDLVSHYVANAPRIMWFLGAGSSRSAGMPTATDIIWDLKFRYYCGAENQDIQSHDLANRAIRDRVQAFFVSRGFPALWSDEEYSFYFDLLFGSDLGAQQRYIQQKLAPDKVSLKVGHRALAALMEFGLARVVFTTNFDAVLETALADVSGKQLSAFHLGSGPINPKCGVIQSLHKGGL